MGIVGMQRSHGIYVKRKAFSVRAPRIGGRPVLFTTDVIRRIFEIAVLHEFGIKSSVRPVVNVFKENSDEHIADFLAFFGAWRYVQSDGIFEKIWVDGQSFRILDGFVLCHFVGLYECFHFVPCHTVEGSAFCDSVDCDLLSMGDGDILRLWNTVSTEIFRAATVGFRVFPL